MSGEEKLPQEEPPPVKRGRGRPKKGVIVPKPPKYGKRGRPPKAERMTLVTPERLDLLDVARELYITGQRPDGGPLPEGFPVKPSIPEVAGLLGLFLGTIRTAAALEKWSERREAYWEKVFKMRQAEDARCMTRQLSSQRRKVTEAAEKYIDLASSAVDQLAGYGPMAVKPALAGVVILEKAAKTLEMVHERKNAEEGKGLSLGSEDWLAMRVSRRGEPVLEIVATRRNP